MYEIVKLWFLNIGNQYNVNPIIFAAIYIGAIPFFTLSIAWFVKNYRHNKSVILPTMSAGLFFTSAYIYLLVAGENVPVWVYGILILMVLLGIYSTVKSVRKKLQQ